MNVDVSQLFQIIGELYVENKLLKARPEVASEPKEFEHLTDQMISELKGILDE